MSKAAWFDLNSKGDIFIIHDTCPNRKRKCKKLFFLI